jgi:alpha-N-acetylglucosamine transferase
MNIEPTNQSNKHTSTGVVLVAFGKPQYYWAAYNLAYSIKRFNKSIKIALISPPLSKGAVYYCPELVDVIDTYVDLPNDYIYVDKRFDPAKVKLLMYDLLPFDNNLFLDVDAVCLKDIEPLINHLVNAGKDYQTMVIGSHTIDKGRDFNAMQWAWADDIWEQYNLDNDATLPAINSSIQFIRKSEQAELLFKTASDMFLNNPIPLHKLRAKWGNGQPDELYTNIALCKLNIDASIDIKSVYITHKKELNISDIEADFYLMGYFGGQRFTPMFYIEWLDRLLKVWNTQDGKNHVYYINRIIENKYVTGKR